MPDSSNEVRAARPIISIDQYNKALSQVRETSIQLKNMMFVGADMKEVNDKLLGLGLMIVDFAQSYRKQEEGADEVKP